MNVNKIYCGLLLLINLSSLFGQIKIHKSITTEDGLINGYVRDIFEDRDGYIWIATMGGISRWDGRNFLNYSELNGLTSNYVFDITQDQKGNIYFATFGTKGITTYKSGNLDTLFNEGEMKLDFVTLLHVASDKLLYICASNGVYQYDYKNIINLNQLNNVPTSPMHKIYETKSGDIYIATSDGLLRFGNNKLELVTEETEPNELFTMALGGNQSDEIFYGTENDIYILKEGNKRSLNLRGKVFKDRINDIYFPNDKIGYFASDLGLAVLNNNNIETLTKKNGLSSNEIIKIFEDSNNTIYLGNRVTGFDIYYPDKIENFNINTGLQSENIYSFLIDRNGTKYFASDKNLYIENNSSNQRNTNNILSDKNEITAMYESNDGEIYLGSMNGIDILESGNFKRILEYKNTRNVQHVNSNQVTDIVETYNNSILVSSFRGVYEIFGDSVSFISVKDGLKNNFIQSIYVTRDSSVIYGYHGSGITINKNDKLKHYSIENGLNNGVINSICESADGSILLGTGGGGLNILRHGFVDTITVENGLSSNEIRSLIIDNNDNVYVATPNGLNIISFDDRIFFIRKLFKEDGLAGNNINLLFKDEFGNIWIATSKGVSKYNPNADKPITNPPKIYLSGVEIFNEKYLLSKLEKSGELNYDQNYIKFIYTGINLSAPEKILYRYRLNGVDHDWVSSNENNVQYTSLDDGDYTFEVKARNEWGYWSVPANLSFTIHPAWWETWWFRLLFISFISSLLWLAFQYRLNYLLKLERLRTKIASDLHDEVGSLLTQISVNADSISYTKDEDKRKEKSSFIRAKSSELINMMSDVIWSIDSRNDNLDSLIDRIHNFAQNFLEQKNISLNFSTNIKNLQKPLKIDFRQNVMLIAKEAINNAVKYSNCSQIDVVINYTNEKFELTISDNGKGFDIDNVKRGNGLNNIKMRADSSGAKIKFKSENGFSINLSKDKL